MSLLIIQIILFLSSKTEPEKTAGSSLFDTILADFTKSQDYIILLISLILIVYIIEWIRYYYKVRRYVNPDTVNLGQITIRGELEKILDPEQVTLVIRSEFSAIQQCLDTIKSEQLNSCPAQASSVDYYFFFSGLKDNTVVTRQNTVIPKIIGIKNQPVLQSNITLELGSVKIPVSDILRSLIAFVGLLPVMPRKRYNKSLIHVSLISHEKNAKVVVHRAGKNGNGSPHVLSVTSLSPFKSMDELNSLLRDMAFMVLELHNAFGDCHWKSMRYLLDGFIEFSQFRNSGLLADRNNAKKLFHKALVADPENNLEALYYSGVMLMVERTTNAIEKAINYFNTAMRTENQKLKALINLGLAFCYAQSYHRLGKRNDQMLKLARKALDKVETYWQDRQQTQDQKNGHKKQNVRLPLISYIKAMILIVKAAHAENIEEKEKISNEALLYAYKSTQLDPLNSMFKNIIGWALMNLAKSGIEILQKGVIPDDERKTAVLSERYLLESLILNPKNKLTHANLCLLYSVPYFIEQNKEDKHDLIYLRSRFHGKKAISIDQNYINGYRDLCLAYIRYGKEDLAEECFLKALELAENPCKDAEIFKDIINEAKENNISEDVLKKWSVPHPELFEPHK